MNQEQNQIKVDFQNTQMISDEDGNVVFTPGYILRKVSKFITGEQQDSLIPVQVWFNPETGKVLDEGLPDFMVDELKKLNKI